METQGGLIAYPCIDLTQLSPLGITAVRHDINSIVISELSSCRTAPTSEDL